MYKHTLFKAYTIQIEGGSVSNLKGPSKISLQIQKKFGEQKKFSTLKNLGKFKQFSSQGG